MHCASIPRHVIFDFAIDMLAEPITPGVRGAVVELLATLDLTDVTRNTDGTVRLSIEYDDETSTQQIVVLRDNGTLQSRDMKTLNSVCPPGPSAPPRPTADG